MRALESCGQVLLLTEVLSTYFCYPFLLDRTMGFYIQAKKRHLIHSALVLSKILKKKKGATWFILSTCSTFYILWWTFVGSCLIGMLGLKWGEWLLLPASLFACNNRLAPLNTHPLGGHVPCAWWALHHSCQACPQ